MNKHKKTAAFVGALFLIALIPNVIANEMINGLIYSDGYLGKIADNKDYLIIGNVLNIACAWAMIFIPITLFPAISTPLKKYVIAYAVFRGLEGILFLIIAIKTLSFIGVAEELLSTKISTDSAYGLGSLIHSEIHWATIVYLIAFCAGATVFYLLLFKSGLVPKWLSVWGLFGVFVLATGTVFAIFKIGVFLSMPQMQGMAYFAPPIALNEFILSLWLIVKGFTTSETSSE